MEAIGHSFVSRQSVGALIAENIETVRWAVNASRYGSVLTIFKERMMKKTARVIITFDCNRKCEYCVNKYPDIMNQAVIIKDLNQLKGFDEIVITGGEPLLNIRRTRIILRDLEYVIVPKAKKYLYTAIFSPDMHMIIDYLDGITYTMHTDYDEDQLAFDSFEEFIEIHNNKSYRLAISLILKDAFTFYPYLWKEIKIKDWKEEGRCEIPEHETLFIYEE